MHFLIYLLPIISTFTAERIYSSPRTFEHKRMERWCEDSKRYEQYTDNVLDDEGFVNALMHCLTHFSIYINCVCNLSPTTQKLILSSRTGDVPPVNLKKTRQYLVGGKEYLQMMKKVIKIFRYTNCEEVTVDKLRLVIDLVDRVVLAIRNCKVLVDIVRHSDVHDVDKTVESYSSIMDTCKWNHSIGFSRCNLNLLVITTSRKQVLNDYLSRYCTEFMDSCERYFDDILNCLPIDKRIQYVRNGNVISTLNN